MNSETLKKKKEYFLLCSFYWSNRFIFLRGVTEGLWGAHLKVPYDEKHVFSGLYVYKLLLPEPANSQNDENKWFLHGLCSPPTGNMALLQAAQIHGEVSWKLAN